MREILSNLGRLRMTSIHADFEWNAVINEIFVFSIRFLVIYFEGHVQTS